MPKRLLTPEGTFPVASLPRRLAALFYDSLLCISLMMAVTATYQQLGLRWFYGAEQLKVMADQQLLDSDPLLSTLLVCCLFAFFAYFWTRTGQTLGMYAWRLRIQNSDGTAIDLWQALLRFFGAWISLACLGMGYLWALYDPQKRTWHDRYSESGVIQLPPPSVRSK